MKEKDFLNVPYEDYADPMPEPETSYAQNLLHTRCCHRVSAAYALAEIVIKPVSLGTGDLNGYNYCLRKARMSFQKWTTTLKTGQECIGWGGRFREGDRTKEWDNHLLCLFKVSIAPHLEGSTNIYAFQDELSKHPPFVDIDNHILRISSYFRKFCSHCKLTPKTIHETKDCPRQKDKAWRSEATPRFSFSTIAATSMSASPQVNAVQAMVAAAVQKITKERFINDEHAIPAVQRPFLQPSDLPRNSLEKRRLSDIDDEDTGSDSELLALIESSENSTHAGSMHSSKRRKHFIDDEPR